MTGLSLFGLVFWRAPKQASIVGVFEIRTGIAHVLRSPHLTVKLPSSHSTIKAFFTSTIDKYFSKRQITESIAHFLDVIIIYLARFYHVFKFCGKRRQTTGRRRA